MTYATYAEQYSTPILIDNAVRLISAERTPDLQNKPSGLDVLTIRLEMDADAYDRWRKWGRRKRECPEKQHLTTMEYFEVKIPHGKAEIVLEGEMVNGSNLQMIGPTLNFTLSDPEKNIYLNGNGSTTSTVDDTEYAGELSASERFPGISRIRILFQRQRKSK